jgi:tryptophanyl-tRNA synthetase
MNIRMINPWKISTLTPKHYDILRRRYNLKNINFKLRDDPNFVKRNLIVGHENLDKFISKAKEKKVALVSGFMTSGFLHLGSLTVIKQMVYYQKTYGVDVIIPIADLEAMCVRKTPLSEVRKRIVEFLAHFFAAGLDPKKTKIYLQTKNKKILEQAILFSSRIDLPELEKIYDRKLTLAEVISSLVMVSDILNPQFQKYQATLITLGIDGISHFSLTKKLISVVGKDFYQPSITYNKILTGLNGSKMGKSVSEDSILLTDKMKIIEKKLLSLKGRRLHLHNNSAFNILEWYSEDDILLNNILELEKKNKTKANDLAIDESIKLCKDLLKKHQKAYKDNFEKAKKIAEKLISD